MGNRAVEVQGLGKRYGKVWALDSLNLEIEQGRIVGLVGTNGSGKTTTIRLLSGLSIPTSGSIRLLEKSIHEALARVGVVMEEPAFYPHLSPLDHMEIGLSFARCHLTRLQRLDLLDRLGVPRPSRPVRHASLGVRRRLALALALAKNPALLLLDEPTNGLDLDGVDLLRCLLREQANKGVSCILSSHNWDQIEQLVDEVVVLHRGTVLYAGSKRGLLGEGAGERGALAEAYRTLTKEGPQ